MSQQSSGKTVQIQDPYLIINNQGNILPSFPLTKDYHRLGRDSSQVDLPLPSAWTIISRVQACLRKEGNSYRIYDGDGTNPSSNKLFINNRVITPHDGHLLHDGDEIKIGQNSQNWITINYYNPSQITAVIKPQQKSLSLLNRSVVLGRDPTATLPLDAPTISRRHAVIDKNSQGQYILHDYSSNGVFINGQKVNGSALLTPGCQIRLAPYIFTLQKDNLVLVDQGEYIRLDVRNIVQVVYKKNKQPLTIINRVSFPVEPAQFIALVGGSGAGKSTLMRILLGMQKPSDGMVYLNGEDLRQNFNIYRQQIGYVPQADIIHRDLTVKEVLYFAAKLRLPKDLELEAVIEKTLEEIELSDRQNTLVKELSGGQIKRVSIGVELLADPKLFFLDEPTSGLDPGLDKKMMQLLKKLAQSGRTIVLVTHATQNIQLCDRLAFLGKGGYLCYFGTPAGAIKFFNITSGDFADIYIRLDNQEVVIQESQRFHNPHSQDYKKYIQDCLNQPQADIPKLQTKPQQAQAPFWQQSLTLTQRYFRLVIADRLSLVWALLTAPLGISLITITLGKQTPLIIPESLNFNEVAKAAPLALKVLFVFTCAAVWVGLSCSLQEIVKEIPIYLRERLVNLRLGAYLLSKVGVLGGLALMQSFLITLVIAIRFASPESYLLSWFLGVYITTFLTIFGSLNLGLMVSACVKNTSQANSILPIILLPQIIFSGVLFNIEKGVNYLAWLMLSRWSIGAYGTLVGIEKFIKKAQEVNNYQAPLPFNDSEGVYNLSWQNLLINWGMLGLHSLLYLGITYLVQKRKEV